MSHSLGANGAFTNTFYLTPCPTGNATCPRGGFVKDANTSSVHSLYPAGFTPALRRRGRGTLRHARLQGRAVRRAQL
ncbi:MAG: hypothetical protein WDN44_08930 [Sphingomonas sp.]